MKEIYFAAGCFWGTEKLFAGLPGVLDTECGYANGDPSIEPDYQRVCVGDTGYRETVRVRYEPEKISLEQLLKAYFYVLDPTVQNQQGHDIGTQYQTGIYWTEAETEAAVQAYVAEERKKYERFFVELKPLSVFHPAEEYHQNYLDKNPGGYCHIPVWAFDEVKNII